VYEIAPVNQERLAMRTALRFIFWTVSFGVGLVPAVIWSRFIWSYDWGTSHRGRGLWMMALGFPAFLIFLAVFFVAFAALSTLWETIFRDEKFLP
jgi:hypothetical protein